LPEGHGLPLGSSRPIAIAAAIAPQLAGDGALAAAQPVGDLRLHFSRPVHVGYDLALLQGKMTCHRRDSFQWECSVKRPLKRPCDVFTYTNFP
jgi:hypothetical protein